MSEERQTPLIILAGDIKKGQVIKTDFGRSYVTNINNANSSLGHVSMIIVTFVTNDVTEKQSFSPDDEIELLRGIDE
jgi:hypothetical protein